MEEQLPEVIGIKQLESGYGCIVNGRFESVFTEESDFRAGRIYRAIQKAIADGAEVEPYVEPVPTPLDLLEQSDMAFIKSCARMLEDIADDREADGKYVSDKVKSEKSNRKSLREQL